MNNRQMLKLGALFMANQAVWLWVANGIHKNYVEMRDLADRAHDRNDSWKKIYDDVLEIAQVALKHSDKEAVGTELKFNEQFREIVAGLDEGESE